MSAPMMWVGFGTKKPVAMPVAEWVEANGPNEANGGDKSFREAHGFTAASVVVHMERGEVVALAGGAGPRIASWCM